VFVGTCLHVIDVYEGIEVAKLKLNCRPNSVVLNHIRATFDDCGPVIYATLVIICEIENKKFAEIKF